MKIVKAIFFAILVGAAAWFCLSAPVRSNLGGKGVEGVVTDDSPNPYISDGLIAMWDGEWNAGFGIHDSDAFVWKDLVGDNNMDVAATSSFGDNYLLNASETDGAVAQRFADDARTVEVVMRIGGYYKYYSCPFVVVNYLSSNTYRGIGKRFEFFTNGLKSYYNTFLWSSESRAINQYSFYMGMIWGDSASFVDAAEKSTSRTTANTHTIDHDATYVHAGQYAVEYYTIRLYNRALTEEEILHNYAVDAERFGL